MGKLLSKKGWKVTVVCTLSTSEKTSTSPDLDFMRAEIQQFTEDIFVLPHFLRTEHFGPFLAHLLLSRGATAMLTSNSYAGYSLLPYIRAAVPSVALVSYVHMRQLEWTIGAPFEKPGQERPGGYPRLNALYSDVLDVSLFVSDDERRWGRLEAAQVNKVWGPGLTAGSDHEEVVHFGFDMQHFDGQQRDMYREKFGLEPGTCAVLFAGRLVEQKQPLVIVRVFYSLIQELSKTEHIHVHLLVAGSGPLLGSMQEYVHMHNFHSQVTFTGIVNHTELMGMMAASDIFFMPSLMEGVAISLIEAVASGLTPVVSDVGGQGEVVVEGTGYCVPWNDTRTMVDSLAKVASSGALRQTMSAKGRQHLRAEFSPERMGSQLDEALVEAGARAAKRTVASGDAAAAVENEFPQVVSAIRAIGGLMGSFVLHMNRRAHEKVARK